MAEGGYSQSPEKSSPSEEQASLSSAESMGPVCARKQPRRKRKKRRGGEGEMGERGRGRKEEEEGEEKEKAMTSLLSLHLFLRVIPETEEANER